MRQSFVGFLALAGVVGLTAAAQAETVQAKFTGTNIWKATRVVQVVDGNNVAVRAKTGIYNFDNQTAESSLSESIATFCLEPNQHISPGGSYNYDIVPLTASPQSPAIPTADQTMTDAAADGIRELWARYRDQIVNPTATSGSVANPTGSSADERAAAFQLAVWELVYDTADKYLGDRSGAFFATEGGNAITIANDWLDTLNGDFASSETLVGLTNSDVQDQMTIVPAGSVPSEGVAVPTPSAAGGAALVLGSIGLVGVIRRRRYRDVH
jgi:hypothetical protein